MKNNILTKIYPKKTIEKVDSKIKLLGIYNELTTAKFINLRLVVVLIVFIGTLLLFKHGYILAIFFAGAVYYLVEKLLIEYPINKRIKKLEKEALFFFEVLVLTLESGRSLKHALNLTTENIDSEISMEFKKTLAEANLGKSLNESLEAMKKRIPSDTINNAILNMIQSNTFGNSITESMYTQIDYLREKQMLDVKAEIAKLPTKVSVISVIFFIPIMMLIILGPILISYLFK